MISPKVLVIDDELNVLKALKRLFSRESFELLTTSDPEYVRTLLQQEPIGILISDQRMPRMPGIKVLEMAKQLSPRTIRILLTAYVDAQVAIDAINLASVHRYLTKPWEDENLLKITRESIEHYLISSGYTLPSAATSNSIDGHAEQPGALSRDISVELSDLVPGMILSRDIFTESSRLLLQENSEITPFRLERLRAIQLKDPIRGKIYVYK